MDDTNRQIRTARRELGVSQREFALRLGVSQPTVCRWERGEVSPVPAVVLHALGALGINTIRRPDSSREKNVNPIAGTAPLAVDEGRAQNAVARPEFPNQTPQVAGAYPSARRTSLPKPAGLGPRS